MGDNTSVSKPFKTNSPLSKPLVQGKYGTYLLPHCLFELPFLFSEIQMSWLHWSAILPKKVFLKPKKQPLSKKNRNHGQLWKAHHECWLVAALFEMARMKVMLWAAWRRVTEWGPPQKDNHHCRRSWLGRQSSWGAGDSWEIAGVFTHQTIRSDSGGGGTNTNSIRGRWAMWGSLPAGRSPTKSFQRVGLRGPRGTGQGQWLPMGYTSTREAPSSSSISAFYAPGAQEGAGKLVAWPAFPGACCPGIAGGCWVLPNMSLAGCKPVCHTC